MIRFALVLEGGQELALPPGHYVLGRAPECEVRLRSATVSRQHARLVVEHDSITLTALPGVSNGTSVNGARMEGTTAIRPPASLRFGDELVEIRERGAAEAWAELGTRPMAKPDDRRAVLETLSPREREVLHGIARGRTLQTIADELEVSVKSVEKYRSRVAAKLGVKDRAELVDFALSVGLHREQ